MWFASLPREFLLEEMIECQLSGWQWIMNKKEIYTHTIIWRINRKYANKTHTHTHLVVSLGTRQSSCLCQFPSSPSGPCTEQRRWKCLNYWLSSSLSISHTKISTPILSTRDYTLILPSLSHTLSLLHFTLWIVWVPRQEPSTRWIP